MVIFPENCWFARILLILIKNIVTVTAYFENVSRSWNHIELTHTERSTHREQ
jgi:hypothetical protein